MCSSCSTGRTRRTEEGIFRSVGLGLGPHGGRGHRHRHGRVDGTEEEEDVPVQIGERRGKNRIKSAANPKAQASLHNEAVPDFSLERPPFSHRDRGGCTTSSPRRWRRRLGLPAAFHPESISGTRIAPPNPRGLRRMRSRDRSVWSDLDHTRCARATRPDRSPGRPSVVSQPRGRSRAGRWVSARWSPAAASSRSGSRRP